jgi:two-component system chemotaxis response regulator CheB
VGVVTSLDRVAALVIGASSGGVEALSMVLPALPADLALPVVVVLHVPRDRSSQLAPIFREKCVVAVEEAQDKLPAQAGTIYFAPPDYHVLLDPGPVLALSADPPVNFSRPSIDVLFESAADLLGGRVMAMLLTGASQDGARGIDAVRRAGGVTAVQDPDSAAASLMPHEALQRGPVDYVLPLPQLADLVRRLPRAGRQPMPSAL